MTVITTSVSNSRLITLGGGSSDDPPLSGGRAAAAAQVVNTGVHQLLSPVARLCGRFCSVVRSWDLTYGHDDSTPVRR